MKGDRRASTVRRQRIRQLASRIRSADQLRAVVEAVPEAQREAFVAAIFPLLKIRKSAE